MVFEVGDLLSDEVYGTLYEIEINVPCMELARLWV
jgi:hypothetical protein